MHVTGHKIVKEPIQIKVDNGELWKLIYTTCFDQYDSVEGSTYWEYVGDNHHNGDPEYKKREAPVFFEKSKGK